MRQSTLDSDRDPAKAEIRTVRISARGRSLSGELRELWQYRSLLSQMVRRDLMVRYKQTIIGAAWAIVQPAASMVLFTLFFGKLAGLASDGLPHPLFYYAGLVPWMYFAGALQGATASVVDYQRVITKVYFPKMLLPMSAVIPGLLDAFIAGSLLLVLLVVYHVQWTPALLLTPLLMIAAAAVALAIGLWLSALNAMYRDVRHIIPFLVQLWMFATPVVYPSSLVPTQWRILYALNPMVGIIDTFRWAVTGAGQPAWESLAVAMVVTMVLLSSGAVLFERIAQTIADVV